MKDVDIDKEITPKNDDVGSPIGLNIASTIKINLFLHILWYLSS